MAGITLAQATERLEAWLAADLAVSSGQEYSIGNRRLKRADVAEIRNQIDYWERKVNQLADGGRSGAARVRYVAVE